MFQTLQRFCESLYIVFPLSPCGLRPSTLVVSGLRPFASDEAPASPPPRTSVLHPPRPPTPSGLRSNPRPGRRLTPCRPSSPECWPGVSAHPPSSPIPTPRPGTPHPDLTSSSRSADPPCPRHPLEPLPFDPTFPRRPLPSILTLRTATLPPCSQMIPYLRSRNSRKSALG